MGNKNIGPHKEKDTETQEEAKRGTMDSVTESISTGGEIRSDLLASLQSAAENTDYTLLPHSLHQIAEAYSVNEDYQWAVKFLQLEKLYHERLLSNLTALQENWESRWREQRKDAESSSLTEMDGIRQRNIDALTHICKNHFRPSAGVEQITSHAALCDLQSETGQLEKNKTAQFSHDKINTPKTSHLVEKGESETAELLSPHTGNTKGGEEEEEAGDEEMHEEGQEVEEEEQCEEMPEDEVKVEFPAGVPQASDKDLAKLSHTDGSSSPNGLVSILKRRRASLDGLPPPSSNAMTPNSKRKVRFSEPEDGMESDEVGGDSCLILLLLCLATVVISIGGTALYCTLVDTYSNICTDFTHNVDFYVTSVRRFVDELRHCLHL
ncbi:consortin, connexin sorting protein b [Thalassophryne amazonica]|uniref:consortin, connexin sorting protein b n=1 Tax=Thalassophryne amazonica TaxID=390379 RepID=UPI0014720BFB|nr:consortin, connexin sorting protein b [Thalassophryne amazonica]